MNRVKPSVLLLLLLSLVWLTGCDSTPRTPDINTSDIPNPPLDPDTAAPNDPAGDTVSSQAQQIVMLDPEYMVADESGIRFDLFRSTTTVSVTFGGQRMKRLLYDGPTPIAPHTSCPEADAGPREIYEDGSWTLTPVFFSGGCGTASVRLPGPYIVDILSDETTPDGKTHHTVVRYKSPEGSDEINITIVIDGLDGGDTTSRR